MAYKKNDVVVLLNNNEVVIEKKQKDTYIVYPLMQWNSPYKSYFKIHEADIKWKANIIL
jgi:hypothetical protein